MTNEMFVKVVELMVALGYSQKIARGQATSQLKKLAVENPMFEDAEYRKAINVITTDEASILLESIAKSKSKYKDNAQKLIEMGLSEDLLTADDTWAPEKPKKARVSKPKKADLEKFIEIKGLSDEFIEWFKASKNEA